MGETETVRVEGFSEELQTDYYSEYRTPEEEEKLLKAGGYRVVEKVDIYPKSFNRWDNTHFYCLVCQPE